MRSSAPLRPELASVCRYLAVKRSARLVRPAIRPPLRGILAELAAFRELP
jgi:hypothetical protein